MNGGSWLLPAFTLALFWVPTRKTAKSRSAGVTFLHHCLRGFFRAAIAPPSFDDGRVEFSDTARDTQLL